MDTVGRDYATESALASTFGIRRSLDGERLIAVFTQLVEPLGRSLPAMSEVVLHDLSLLPNSIVAIHGSVTGRKVGDPSTDLLLEKLSHRDTTDLHLNYVTVLPDGRRLRSSTMILRDVGGNPVAALCINSDPAIWETVVWAAQSMLGQADDADVPVVVQRPLTTEPPEGSEAFVRDIDELAQTLLQRSLEEVGLPVESMQKRHKLDVVRRLRARGLFMLKDAVEQTASALHVTRFTIYNYLNEIEQDQPAESEETTT